MKDDGLQGAVEEAVAGYPDADIKDLIVQATSKNPKWVSMREVERKQRVDFAFRTVLAKFTGNDCDHEKITNLVDLAIICAKEELSSLTTPHNLLEDSLETSVLEVCEKIFSFMEERLTVWTSPSFANANSMITMLRICNALKKRLSKHQHTVFCGRILIFLASVTPLSDKSGVNQGSAFNLNNETIFEEEPASESEGSKAAAADAASENDRPTDTPVDFVFYRQFWTLQRYFCDPTLCYKDVQWIEFAKCCAAVMKSFRDFKLEEDSEKPNDLVNSDEYFAKFLTSSKLFRLQQSDSQFRRQILIQMLVVFQYLTGTVKFKKDTYVLTPKQTEWLKKTQLVVYQLLKTTPPDGDRFAADIKRIMESEEHWVEWKNAGCPPFAKGPADLKRSRESEGDSDKQTKKFKLDLGSGELTRLWNITADNITGCKAMDRRSMPASSEFFQEALQQIDPANAIEKAYWSINNEAFCWKSLRLLGNEKLHYFQELTTGSFKKMPDYLEKILKKMASESSAKMQVDSAPE